MSESTGNEPVGSLFPCLVTHCKNMARLKSLNNSPSYNEQTARITLKEKNQNGVRSPL